MRALSLTAVLVGMTVVDMAADCFSLCAVCDISLESETVRLTRYNYNL